VRETLEAIVIGAGPAGCIAATLLAQAGWSVALIEKARFPRRKVCGECIAPTNFPLLRALGMADAFFERAGPELKQAGLMAGARFLTADLPPFDDPLAPWGRVLGRDQLDLLLLQRAAQVGVEVWQPWSVREMTRTDAMHHCQIVSLDTGETLELSAPVVIAAHGSWEPGPLPIPAGPRRPSDLFAFKANFRGAALTPGVLPVLAFPGGYGGMVVGACGRVTLAACIRRDVLRRCRDLSPGIKAAEAVFNYIAGSCLEMGRALRNAEREGEWLSVGPLRIGFRGHYRQGVWVIGNAANETHPIIGEGISMAMQSAWLLCERLIDAREMVLSGRGWEVVGQNYADCWRRSFFPRVRVAATLAHLAMRPAAVTILTNLLERFPGLITASARWSGKTRRVCA
jgi:2-polyprenyl-6-methoxyphenol hydroxylase-like FAD-dependent oxidoreductase